MQPLRGTKDLLPNEIIFWQYIYNKAFNLLSLSNYREIRTPIIESTDLFQRGIGNDTDIINKEMYSFNDQSNRRITLRPEGTASIARSFISNKLYQSNKIERFWYFAPMFRYERPQNGRQRQFHQLGIECIGSMNPIADVEVIRLANNLLYELECYNFDIEINSIGNINERNIYKKELINYLIKYKQDLDSDSQKRLYTNPLRILDSKNEITKNIISNGPSLKDYLQYSSIEHFHAVCEQLNYLNIKYQINDKLIRGLDYYNDTAFEIKTKSTGNQNTICGGGRYDSLIQELGGPNTPSVGWAIGIERLLSIIKQNIKIQQLNPTIYIAIQGKEAQIKSWEIINTLEKEKIHFELNLENNSFQKQIKKADKSGASVCIILGNNEIINKSITLKILNKGIQKTIVEEDLIKELRKLKIS
uniref:histidine--tRNA ligase n=1 Tax=Plocamium cartilagineum TaxID=31452 RepID=A0A1C9CHZ2_PLOCA|nr:histidine-tRNA synthetase [Plocamium cartilagineum]AOM67977.1 histidine-tRNA synthetase [Plocamium cartilagineum]